VGLLPPLKKSLIGHVLALMLSRLQVRHFQTHHWLLLRTVQLTARTGTANRASLRARHETRTTPTKAKPREARHPSKVPKAESRDPSFLLPCSSAFFSQATYKLDRAPFFTTHPFSRRQSHASHCVLRASSFITTSCHGEHQ